MVNGKKMKEIGIEPTWTFLSNHAHVLICLFREPDLTLREVAESVGITERSAQRIVAELVDTGYLEKSKVGRVNKYKVNLKPKLRHHLEAHKRIGDLLRLLA
jgi:DNA-binding MarR family transcriptional regulator